MNHDTLMRAAPVSFSFTSQLANLKNTLTLWEDVVAKTMKLSAALRTVIQCIAGFLEAFQKVADSAYGSNCGLRELGSCMTRFCLRERGLESRLRTFNTQLTDCLAAPLSDRLEEWRRTVAQLERENSKEWRRARSELQRVTSEVDKLNKRFRRKGSASTHGDCNVRSENSTTNLTQTGENMQLNFVQHDLAVKQRTLAELERSNLRRAVVEERRRFAELITCLKPVLDSQTAIFNDVGPIDECIAAISKQVYDPNDLSSDTEQAIEEAVDHISTSRTTYDRKFSDVRSMMRFGKGGGVGFDAISLRRSAGHSSQLSLQSSTSTSNSSWNTISSSTAMSNRTTRRCPSPISTYSGMDGAEQKADDPQSPHFVSTAAFRGGSGADSFSLFDQADTAPVADLPCPNRNHLKPVVNGKTSFTSYSEVDQSHNGPGSPTNGIAGQLQFGPTDLAAPSSENGKDEQVDDDEDEADHIEEGGDGGGTTEDTEDGETEDDEHLNAVNGNHDGDKPHSILYPNQAIPAPVYTNLNELKRAAARKFRSAETANTTNPASLSSSRESPRATNEPVNQVSPHTTLTTDSDSRHPIAESCAVSGVNTCSVNPPTLLPSVDSAYATSVATSGTVNHANSTDSNGGLGHLAGSADGFITTCVNSGTSTFRRRQSEYARRHHADGSAGIGHTSRIMNYASPTPAVIRRGSQACTDASGRGPVRPTNPPRRSSSVSREFSHIRPSSVMPEHFAASGFMQPTGTHSNGMDHHPGIQRVSSSVFTHGDPVMSGQCSGGGGAEYWPTTVAHGIRPNLIQLPPGPTTMMSKPVPYSTASPTYSESQMVRMDRSKGMFLTPPPLATVTAPTHSKGNQLMFGVKVLPSQVSVSGMDQISSSNASALAVAAATVATNRQLGRHKTTTDSIGGHYASASRLHRTPGDDRSTSFIE